VIIDDVPTLAASLQFFSAQGMESKVLGARPTP
jgi:hypothetical protein